jgi:hypothetical protein
LKPDNGFASLRREFMGHVSSKSAANLTENDAWVISRLDNSRNSVSSEVEGISQWGDGRMYVLQDQKVGLFVYLSYKG